jgi:hypothetical protein
MRATVGRTVSEAREERLAHNEVVFRTVNEQIEGLALKLGDDVSYDFVCECATSGCFERINLGLAEYEAIRADGTRFVLRPGHEDIEVERVISVHDEYVVVEKDGVAGLVAEAANPRG